jgi:prephenate dehydrogenase
LRIGIVGLGLIGTSVALAARRAWPDATLVELDRGDDLRRLKDVELIVLATPVDVILQLLRDEIPAFPSAIVLDTGSTKRAIVAAARAAGLRNFVGGHPMAGASIPGSAAAKADLFDGRLWFLIGDGPALDRARDFVAALGASAVVMTDDGSEHDRVMAAVSHLPQIVASVMMTVIGEAAGVDGLASGGSGLRDTTRLAASAASMWESIVATNAEALRPLLIKLADDLREIAGQLENPEAVRRLFTDANRWKRAADAK